MSLINLPYEDIEATGDIPQERFGHTITPIGSQKAILFGGAIGNSGKYIMTSDTYLFSSTKFLWTKLRAEGALPAARAAHSATLLDTMQIALYGGAAGGTYISIHRGCFVFR